MVCVVVKKKKKKDKNGNILITTKWEYEAQISEN